MKKLFGHDEERTVPQGADPIKAVHPSGRELAPCIARFLGREDAHRSGMNQAVIEVARNTAERDLEKLVKETYTQIRDNLIELRLIPSDFPDKTDAKSVEEVYDKFPRLKYPITSIEPAQIKRMIQIIKADCKGSVGHFFNIILSKIGWTEELLKPFIEKTIDEQFVPKDDSLSLILNSTYYNRTNNRAFRKAVTIIMGTDALIDLYIQAYQLSKQPDHLELLFICLFRGICRVDDEFSIFETERSKLAVLKRFVDRIREPKTSDFTMQIVQAYVTRLSWVGTKTEVLDAMAKFGMHVDFTRAIKGLQSEEPPYNTDEFEAVIDSIPDTCMVDLESCKLDLVNLLICEGNHTKARKVMQTLTLAHSRELAVKWLKTYKEWANSTEE
ncbi:MAG: hypothetical protein SP1CHLAM54_07660 [Chlamydiia bacterium]|nr:hypothetical protein [Chlamydiia bacterium]MCH9615672.1 hypothetical protein [Chlamydiia bacterium]MCH9628925.1 hypothetical protein [Chlamydiia bacterium]